jgi:hypothetical protein
MRDRYISDSLMRTLYAFVRMTCVHCMEIRVHLASRGGLSRGTSMRKPGSEDPHRRQQKLEMLLVEAKTLWVLGMPLFLPSFFCFLFVSDHNSGF